MNQRKHLMLRTRSTRLVRKTIGFATSAEMHDIVMGLCVKRDEFWLRP
jgi:IS1 family transposase